MANNQNLLDARLRPLNGTRQPPPPSHPSRGGDPYSDDLCRQVLQMYFDNVGLCDAPELIPLRAQITIIDNTFHGVIPTIDRSSSAPTLIHADGTLDNIGSAVRRRRCCRW